MSCQGEGKRAVERGSQYGNRARRLLTSADIAAIEKEMMHRLESNLEPLIRRVVAEEMDRRLSNFAMRWRLPLRQIAPSTAASRQFHLHFISSPAAESTYTDTKLEGECGDTIRVRLVDVTTRQLVAEGLESAAELDVVPLMGHFNTPDEEDWSAEEFERYVAQEREHKGPLLVGELKVHLKGGLGTLGDVSFTDNSSWTRSRKFRLGVRPAHDKGPWVASIREGKSEAFSVKENRGKGYQKHGIPSPNDEVWRLRYIARDGPIHRNLRQNDIYTVKDFLHWARERPEALKKVLGKMHAKAYEGAVAHARRCVHHDRMYVCSVNQPASLIEKVIFSQDCQAVGAVANGKFVALDKLSGTEKVQMDACIQNSYNNWHTEVAECVLGDDVAIEDEPLDMAASTGAAADDMAADGIWSVEPLPPQFIQADAEFMNNAMAAGPSNNIEPIAEPLNWDQQYTIGMISDSLWGYDSGELPTNIDVELSSHSIASHVQEVLREKFGDYGDACIGDPRGQAASTLPNSKWWLRIRAGVRCALFIRNASLTQQQQQEEEQQQPPSDYHNI